MQSPRPPIGVPRCYDSAVCPLIYPGEVASAQIDPAAIAAVLQAGGGDVPITGWLIEPAPGWHARYLRLRYRIWGQWFSRGAKPTLVASAGFVTREKS